MVGKSIFSTFRWRTRFGLATLSIYLLCWNRSDHEVLMTALTLTFDNGPDPKATPGVLDILKDFGIFSTFFVIGEKLARPGARALAERAQDEGHWIGNHTMTHSATFGRIDDPARARAEIMETERLLCALAHPDHLFRPYGGGGVIDHDLLSSDAIACLEGEKMTCVTWTTVPGDWKDPGGWAARALADCEGDAPKVLALHDIEGAALAGLPGFLENALRRGVRFVQEFPEDVVLMRRGVVQRDLSPFMQAR
jgi:peptidoglycan-N-acetylglucosamine deacetylase